MATKEEKGRWLGTFLMVGSALLLLGPALLSLPFVVSPGGVDIEVGPMSSGSLHRVEGPDPVAAGAFAIFFLGVFASGLRLFLKSRGGPPTA